MVVIYDKVTGKIHQTILGDEFPSGIELSSDEAYATVKEVTDPHTFHLCQLELNKAGEIVKIERPLEEWLKERRKMT